MSTRENFIGAVSNILGRESLPDKPTPLVYRHTVHSDVMRDWPQEKMLRAFVDYSESIGVQVVETTAPGAAQAIRQLVARMKAGDIILADEPLIQQLGVMKTLAADRLVKKWDIESSREENIGFAEQAIAGIAVADMALAESGTVMLFCQAGSGRSVSLLPESTIYLIPQSRIKPRLTQAMAHLDNQQDRPSSINFVSGPSATADIELVRVVGVHGPVAVVYVVIGDL